MNDDTEKMKKSDEGYTCRIDSYIRNRNAREEYEKCTEYYMDPPKYHIGDIIDLSGTYGKKMPDRITPVVIYASRKHNEWYYKVFSECMNGYIHIGQSEIDRIEWVYYDTPEVIAFFNDGYRFCGNFNKSEIDSIKEFYGAFSSVHNVVVNNLYSGKTKKMSVWVRYKEMLVKYIDKIGPVLINTSFIGYSF
jgi:hypothetical protein